MLAFLSSTQRSRVQRMSSVPVFLLTLSLCVNACGQPPPPLAPGALQEFQPDYNRGGRAVAVDVSPVNVNVAIAASEQGGLFKTSDGGTTWHHIDSLIPFSIADVRFVPADLAGQILLVTTAPDMAVTNNGGIWRSTDSGSTWTHTAVPSCPSILSGYGIAFVPGSNDVYVGTDCGLVISHDRGATWTLLYPQLTYSVVVQAGSNPIDICANGYRGIGHYRSTNLGSTFFQPSNGTSPEEPNCRSIHSIASSPFESNVLFGTLEVDNTTRHLLESDDGGVTWTDLQGAPYNERPIWVKTERTGPSTFDVYLPGERQSCTNNPVGLLCTRDAWTLVPTTSLNHDLNDVAFSPTGSCPQFMALDFGMLKADSPGTTTCTDGSSWQLIGNGPQGFNALQIYQVTGQKNFYGTGAGVTPAPTAVTPVPYPGYTDLYIGTQDNQIAGSPDGGKTWQALFASEGYALQTPQWINPGGDSALYGLSFVACSPCSIRKAPRSGNLLGPAQPWPVHGPAGGDPPVVLAPGVYVTWAGMDLYMTTDDDQSFWTKVATLPQNVARKNGFPHYSGSMLYWGVTLQSGQVSLLQITGIRNPQTGSPQFGQATVVAGTGLSSIATYIEGYLFGIPVFAVDPFDASHLIAADVGNQEMEVSHDGGQTWKSDTALTYAVTSGKKLYFSTVHGVQVHVIAFDPDIRGRILVGTEQAGIVFSDSGGDSWGNVANSTEANSITSFFFDGEIDRVIDVATYGRGLWQFSWPTGGFSVNQTPSV